jgi:hypothetical protein
MGTGSEPDLANPEEFTFGEVPVPYFFSLFVWFFQVLASGEPE